MYFLYMATLNDYMDGVWGKSNFRIRQEADRARIHITRQVITLITVPISRIRAKGNQSHC